MLLEINVRETLDDSQNETKQGCLFQDSSAIGKWTNYRTISNYILAEHAKYNTTIQNFGIQHK